MAIDNFIVICTYKRVNTLRFLASSFQYKKNDKNTNNPMWNIAIQYLFWTVNILQICI